MYLSKFQLFNYKSFLDSGLLEFTPGINIIVGANNSGKTALLEALTMNFGNAPHRSIKSLETPDSKIDSESRAEIVLHLDKGELRTLLHKIPPKIGIPDPPLHNDNEYSFQHESDESEALSNEVYKAVSQFNVLLYDLDSLELNLELSISSNLVEDGIITERLNFDLYLPSPKQYKSNQYSFTEIQQRSDKKFTPDFMYESEENLPDNPPIHHWSRYEGSVEETIVYKIFNLFRNRIYRFYAERLNVHSCPLGESSELKPDASNLPEVLYVLQNLNPPRFSRFNHYVSIIFPQIEEVSVRPENSTLEIMVWSIEAAKNEREDLAFPLSACGTGISQVLAILYVVLTSQEPRTIIIDEPQSFLHPGAAKKLVEILREFPQHQYFIATHSPMIIAAANPSTIVKLRYEDGETKASVMNSEDVKEQRSLLTELGVSLSDVFGADNILWVEGDTEELCFPLIIEKVLKKPLRGTTILKVRSTGELVEQKNKKITEIIFGIYHQLSTGKSLVPDMKFVFDSEGKPKPFQEDIQRKSQKRVEFIKRRMYENYLLYADAITAVINGEYESLKESLTSEEIEAPKVDAARVEKTLEEKKQNKRYFPKNFQPDNLSNSEWVNENIDGAKLLYDLFSELSEARIEFRKTKHSFELTEWLVEKEPDRLSELAEFLQNVLDRREEKLRGCL
jgi:AAA15 family ATPase/GTPase